MKKLKILAGPTGVGKSDMAIDMALSEGSPAISCDSRQLYRQMSIGTAVPTREQLSAVEHHFIQCIDIGTVYSAADYERDAVALLKTLFASHDTLVMVGGSGLYIDAVTNGFDDIPDTDPEIRTTLSLRAEGEGFDVLLSELECLDPVYYAEVDKSNRHRVLRALEVALSTGHPFSSFRTGGSKSRFFEVEKYCLIRARDELYNRINRRVDIMVSDGLISEAESLYPFRELNALQTVGYRELFDYFDGKITKDTAIDLIKRNSRRYAKRQITWFKNRGFEFIKA